MWELTNNELSGRGRWVPAAQQVVAASVAATSTWQWWRGHWLCLQDSTATRSNSHCPLPQAFGSLGHPCLATPKSHQYCLATSSPFSFFFLSPSRTGGGKYPGAMKERRKEKWLSGGRSHRGERQLLVHRSGLRSSSQKSCTKWSWYGLEKGEILCTAPTALRSPMDSHLPLLCLPDQNTFICSSSFVCLKLHWPWHPPLLQPCQKHCWLLGCFFIKCSQNPTVLLQILLANFYQPNIISRTSRSVFQRPSQFSCCSFSNSVFFPGDLQ